ncbi:MAG TPA: hypothetical protein PLZ08_13415 [Bacillota bacterium]|nr:hypothetical protein [Bacillota bacterium]HOL11220.1 hypothetical protein [Bacillota bacterium]HPO98940.1 hypothetical protein [Bacillota bacterium]
MQKDLKFFATTFFCFLCKGNGGNLPNNITITKAVWQFKNKGRMIVYGI